MTNIVHKRRIRLVSFALIISSSLAGCARGPLRDQRPEQIQVKTESEIERRDREAQERRVNRNIKTTALGRLCWTAHEWGTAQVDFWGTTLSKETAQGVVAPLAADSPAKVRALRAFLNAVPEHLGSDLGLPPGAQEYRRLMIKGAAESAPLINALADDATNAEREEFLKKFYAIYLLENDQADEFVGAAKLDPISCPNINAPPPSLKAPSSSISE